MAVIEGRGRTVEEAITDALARTGLKRAQVEVTVVSEGKAKMLGLIGGEDAVVEITPKIQPLGDVSPEVKSYIEDSVNKLISLAELDVTVDAFDDEGTLFVEINGADSALVIGRYGDTLSAIQTIVRAIAFRKFSQKLSIVIDSEGYLKRHEDKLRDFAIRTAKEAQRNGEPIELEPMNARERRIVHMALASISGVSTESTGEGRDRRIVIYSNGKGKVAQSRYDRR